MSATEAIKIQDDIKRREEIYALLTDTLITVFEVNPDNVTLETHLYEDLELDSIDAIDFIDHIKRKTGYTLQAEEFRNVRTVADVVDALLKHQPN